MKAIPFILILLLTANTPDDLTDRGREIFDELDQRRKAVKYETSYLSMTIYDSRGRTRTRELKTWSYNDESTTKTLIVFESPADVRGTGLLSLNEDGHEQQQLYLPSLDRIQTIGGSERGDRFMGSDFTYEDLGTQNPDNFSFREMDHTDTQYVIKAVPEIDSEYAYIVFYIDREHYTLDKAEYFNEQDEQYKELVAEDFVEVEPGIRRADQMTMYDLENDRKTVLRWSDRTINEPIPERYFTERQLRRGVQ